MLAHADAHVLYGTVLFESFKPVTSRKSTGIYTDRYVAHSQAALPLPG